MENHHIVLYRTVLNIIAASTLVMAQQGIAAENFKAVAAVDVTYQKCIEYRYGHDEDQPYVEVRFPGLYGASGKHDISITIEESKQDVIQTKIDQKGSLLLKSSLNLNKWPISCSLLKPLTVVPIFDVSQPNDLVYRITVAKKAE